MRSRRGGGRRSVEARGGTPPAGASGAGFATPLAAPGMRAAPGAPTGTAALGSRPGSPRPPGTRQTLAAGQRGSSAGWIPVGALLPLRLFVGFTLLYAGLDKLALDPTFLDLTSRTSILAQLQGYAHASPLAPLISTLAVPNAWLVGLLIALAEIAVGLGVLTGLAFRVAAVGGAALSTLFFLTASWNVHPYYYGQDLPYALGFVTLAAAGHGDRYVVGPWLERQLAPRTPAARRASAAPPLSAERRLLLQAGVVALGALVLGVVARPLRDVLLPLGPAGRAGSPGSSAGTISTGGASSAAPASGAGGSGAAAGVAPGSSDPLAIGTTAEVAQAGAFEFQVPTAIGNAAPGDPGIVVALGSGKYAAFDAVCTHAGCTVGWDPGAGLLICPCHGAAFDPRNNAQPVAGPATVPLAELPIAISPAGVITLRA